MPFPLKIHASHLKSSIIISMAYSSAPHIFPLTAQIQSSPTNLPICTLLENCSSMEQVKQIQSHAIKTGVSLDPIVQARLISLCCTREWSDVEYARLLFDKIVEPDVFVWNTMIKGYSQRSCPDKALCMYLDMLRKDVKPDNYTFPFLLKGLARGVSEHYRKEIHAHVTKFGFECNSYVQNALIIMYALNGHVDTARRIFDMSSRGDVVSWNAMISGYNRRKLFNESMKLFDEMERDGVLPTSVTLVSLLSACSKLKDIDTGQRLHRYVHTVVEPDLILENALIAMYATCGQMATAVEIFRTMRNRDIISWTAIVAGFANTGQVDHAQMYFDQMPEKDFVSWTAMLDGYIRVNRFKEALTFFREMQISNIKPDEFTVVSVLTACAHLGALELGEWINAYIDKNNIKKDEYVGNALIDMYFKCGHPEKALWIFNEMPQRDKFTWTAMIVGLAINGQGEEALDMFSRMQEAAVPPDEITFIGVLCACTHAGMVDEGRKFFASMITEYGIEPNIAHYGCMVDLLGRAGKLREAQQVIMNMPIRPTSIIWGTILGACRVHRNVEMAEHAAEKLVELEPENGSVYVLLCNIYAVCNKLEKLRELRNLMMDKGIKKTPGCSLIEMNGSVHEFVAGDQSHPQSKQIYKKLSEISDSLKLAGHFPNTSEVFLDIGEEEKESAVYKHSEKLAMAFGLISSGPGITIRIVKNLRMCIDCHSAAKLVSRMYDREIIVRDRTRFHHFRHGACTCNEYW